MLKAYVVWLKGRSMPVLQEAEECQRLSEGGSTVWSFLVGDREVASFTADQVQGVQERASSETKIEKREGTEPPARQKTIYQPQV